MVHLLRQCLISFFLRASLEFNPDILTPWLLAIGLSLGHWPRNSTEEHFLGHGKTMLFSESGVLTSRSLSPRTEGFFYLSKSWCTFVSKVAEINDMGDTPTTWHSCRRREIGPRERRVWTKPNSDCWFLPGRPSSQAACSHRHPIHRWTSTCHSHCARGLLRDWDRRQRLLQPGIYI